MCVLPPLEGWDEYQHLAYIQHLQQYDRPPVWGEDHISRQFLDELAKWPQSNWGAAQFPRGQVMSYAEYWTRGGRATAVASNTKIEIYEGQQPVLYYRLVEPIYVKSGGAQRLLSTVGALRLANLAFLAGATILFAGAIRTFCPEPWLHVPVLVALALNPMLLSASVRVANDALALFGAAIVLRLGTWICSNPPAIQAGRNRLVASILLGLLTGMAILCKTTNLALLPFVAYASWVGAPGRAWFKRLSGAFWTLFVAGLTLLHYIRTSIATYGVPIPAQEVIVNHHAARGVKDYLAAAGSMPWPKYLSGWWISHNLWVGGWSELGAPRILQNIYFVVMWASVAGWLLWGWRAWRRPPQSAPGRFIRFGAPLLLIASFSASLATHAVSSQLAWGTVETNPWYAAPAVPMLLLLAIAGLRLYPWQRVASVLCIALPVVYLAAELTGLCFIMPRAYTISRGIEAMRRLALLHPSWLGTTTFFTATACVAIIAVFVAIGSWRCFWDLDPHWKSER